MRLGFWAWMEACADLRASMSFGAKEVVTLEVMVSVRSRVLGEGEDARM
jgi:hypothetical protein